MTRIGWHRAGGYDVEGDVMKRDERVDTNGWHDVLCDQFCRQTIVTRRPLFYIHGRVKECPWEMKGTDETPMYYRYTQTSLMNSDIHPKRDAAGPLRTLESSHVGPCPRRRQILAPRHRKHPLYLEYVRASWIDGWLLMVLMCSHTRAIAAVRATMAAFRRMAWRRRGWSWEGSSPLIQISDDARAKATRAKRTPSGRARNRLVRVANPQMTDRGAGRIQ